MKTILFLAAFLTFQVIATVDDATRKIVQDALFEALQRLDMATEPSVSDGSIVDSQVANEDSKKLQFNGEVLELASQILVEKYGVGILEQANEVLQEMNGGGDSSEESSEN
uniref:Secreted protein n=1 Tax=Caenorhabditis tropicalis TaxID=1561998 RepID=A0A1I7UBL1_9PELO